MHMGVLLILFYYSTAYVTAAIRHNKVLFPAAQRTRRSSGFLVNPVFQNSLKEVELLYEFLFSGLELDKKLKISVKDEELASLRIATKLDVLCNDIIPKTIPEIKRLNSALVTYATPLTKEDFERTVLTMVYIAYQAARVPGSSKDIWADSFLKLYQALKKDLKEY
ncbi:protein FAM180A-like [Protopterus annectens]|uniref:protein FAM180A-like n=1 Tax=Protopterus annectens TaxID=7888 RepID=UPI001CFAAE76|nr:protein FAM180A-like [Protopterus annectens]